MPIPSDVVAIVCRSTGRRASRERRVPRGDAGGAGVARGVRYRGPSPGSRSDLDRCRPRRSARRGMCRASTADEGSLQGCDAWRHLGGAPGVCRGAARTDDGRVKVERLDREVLHGVAVVISDRRREIGLLSDFNYYNCVAEGLGVELEPDRADAGGASAQMAPWPVYVRVDSQPIEERARSRSVVRARLWTFASTAIAPLASGRGRHRVVAPGGGAVRSSPATFLSAIAHAGSCARRHRRQWSGTRRGRPA